MSTRSIAVLPPNGWTITSVLKPTQTQEREKTSYRPVSYFTALFPPVRNGHTDAHFSSPADAPHPFF